MMRAVLLLKKKTISKINQRLKTKDEYGRFFSLFFFNKLFFQNNKTITNINQKLKTKDEYGRSFSPFFFNKFFFSKDFGL